MPICRPPFMILPVQWLYIRQGPGPACPSRLILYCFNPCFVRRGSGSIFLDCIIVRLSRVSILVLLEGVLEGCRQSRRSIRIRSFNPCFVGRGSGSFGSFFRLYVPGKFQSLFCWKGFWKLFCSILCYGYILSFNPCFVGRGSGSILWHQQFIVRKWFQSLFCWKGFWKGVYGILGNMILGFQSLFCWKGFWK